jgi:hypothetical protein
MAFIADIEEPPQIDSSILVRRATQVNDFARGVAGATLLFRVTGGLIGTLWDPLRPGQIAGRGWGLNDSSVAFVLCPEGRPNRAGWCAGQRWCPQAGAIKTGQVSRLIRRR